MRRIVFFTDSSGPTPMLHFHALLEAVAARDDFEIGAVVTGRPGAVLPSRARRVRAAARARLAGWLSPESRRDGAPRLPLDLRAAGRRHGFRVLVPEANDVNDPRFVDRLAKELRPDVAFSCFCFRRMRPPLLGVFEQAVNYHDGFLPGYRGAQATAWSIERGERLSGWTFHRMTPELDAGDVLLSGGVEIGDGVRGELRDVSWRKAADASRHVPELLEAIAEQRPGEPQRGEVRVFRLRDLPALQRIERPGELDEGELRRRLRAFGVLHLKLDGAWWPTSRIERGPGPLGFVSRDGVELRATRFRDLPRALFRLRSGVRGAGSPP